MGDLPVITIEQAFIVFNSLGAGRPRELGDLVETLSWISRTEDRVGDSSSRHGAHSRGKLAGASLSRRIELIPANFRGEIPRATRPGLAFHISYLKAAVTFSRATTLDLRGNFTESLRNIVEIFAREFRRRFQSRFKRRRG